MLLDFQMPRLNGIQVVEHLRIYIRKLNQELVTYNLQIKHPRVVFLTAFLTSAFKQHIAKLGVKHAYEKPCQINTLKEILGLPFKDKNVPGDSESEYEGQSVMSVHDQEENEEANEDNSNFKFRRFS